MNSQTFNALEIPLQGQRLIEASAGTGKTFSLAALYLRLVVEKQVPVREILVITFTRAATKELRERIQRRLVHAATRLQDNQPAPADDAEARFVDELVAACGEERATLARRLDEAANRMDEAVITTIHGFTQRAVADNAFDSALPFDRGEQVADRPIVAEVTADYWRAHAIGANATPGFTDWWPTADKLFEALKDLRARPEARLAGPEHDEIETLAAETLAAWQEDGDAFVEELRACWDLLKKGGLKTGIEAHGGCDAAFECLTKRLNGDTRVPALPEWTAHLNNPKAEFNNRKKGAVERGEALFERPLAKKLVDLQPLAQLQALRKAHRWIDTTLAERKRERRQFSFDDMIGALHAALIQSEQGAALADALHATWPWALVDEFQDTDPRQYQILRRIHDQRDHGALLLIGDPKQSIYGFRGGDVFTYLSASADTEEAKYTLSENFRTVQPLLDAIEALFAVPGGNPFLVQGIDFPHVDSGRRDKRSLHLGDAPVAPLTFWHLALKNKNKSRAERACLNACVAQIRKLLDPHGGALKCTHDPNAAETTKPRLQPDDIAVLVNTNQQAANIQRALARIGIAAVCIHQASVYASAEAQDLLHILKAAANPADERVLRGALPGALLGHRLADLLALDTELANVQAVVDAFQHIHQRWQHNGAMAALQPLIQNAAPRLLGYDDGERRLSNYLQLAELLAHAEREAFGMAGLVQWLRRAIRDADDKETADAEQLRLESDAELVRITTVHKSKGLEYKVVLLPFAPWLGAAGHPDKPPLTYHDRDNHAVIDIIGNDRDDGASGTAVREARAEGLRLLYVALTRAELACFLPWGITSGAQNSALASLLHRENGISPTKWSNQKEGRPLEAEAVGDQLQQLVTDAAGTIAVTHLPEAVSGSAVLQPERPETWQARVAPAPGWQPWSIHSFTRLAHAAAPGPAEGGASDEAAAIIVEPEQRERNLPELPAGPAFGTAVHNLLEAAGPGHWPLGEATTKKQYDQIESRLGDQGMASIADKIDPAIIEATAGLIRNAVNTPLPDIGPLAAVAAHQRLAEMGFMLRLGGTRLSRFLGVLHEAGYATGLQRDAEATLGGMMNGFVDLIVEADGRYFVIDYKTNWLGNHSDDYHPDALKAAIQQHHYDLQYLIYLIALHRYLRQRLPDYDPARHLGGAQYLFLRGMAPDGGDRGIYRDRPDPALIERLANMLDHAASGSP